MPAQIRSAYPRFPETFPPLELQRHYTLTEAERAWVRTKARGDNPQLGLTLLLKTCQYLGYFPPLEEVPQQIVHYLRVQLQGPLPADAPAPALGISPRTLYAYHGLLREYLSLKAFCLEAVAPLLRQRLTQAAQTMNWVTDLINVGIEVLVKEHYELPAYSTLERLAGNVRATVHHEIFQTIEARLADEIRAKVRTLLTPARGRGDKTAAWTRLKELPKRATLESVS